MIKALARYKKQFWRLSFERQMRFFITTVILAISTIILLGSTISAVLSLTSQSKKMAMDQLTTLANNFESELDNYKSLTVALQINHFIQNYLTYQNKREDYYSESAFEAYNSLLNIININENIRFIAVVNPQLGDYIYKGNRTISTVQMAQSFEKDYENAFLATIGTLRISYDDTYFKENEYSLNLYQPMYSVSNMVKEIGLLIISVEDSLLKQLTVKEDGTKQSDIYLIDSNHTFITPSRNYKIGETLQIKNRLLQEGGSFREDNNLYIYQKIGKWNYYLIHQIPLAELYQTSVDTLIFLVVIIFVLAVIALLFAGKMVTKAYKPLEKVISKMDTVSDGQIDTRINSDYLPSDFKKLALGFNDMMEKIGDLMEQVKLEQHQLEQIRFNALQSQIQPHFLYNTLDCIHWQSIAQGNEEVSTMVKALAQYYRICLSKGKEIIKLEKEIELIKSYLVIQNMRYDNIIETNIIIEEKYLNIMIPKMTLQPLVENSIYHGLKEKEGKTGNITVLVEERDGDVYIIVEDSGTGMSQEEIDEINASISEYDDSIGYGVRNVNKRIELIYGEQYGLFYIRNEQGGVTVEIHFPMTEESAYKEIL